ncbi:hypothetical protein D9615_006538 [Tricholomella constricta]|uniref:Uncharacterized protein n=1 Tax=Tricholomella constricta TaxID=117010 RepID=A0A8H5H9Y1_9AGAR|nr:hypothetical protein D9615_006538 [Tricholomella constricta]
MKFVTNLISLTTLLAAVSAQRVSIGYPQDGASVKSGDSITVEVDRPNTLSGSTEVAIVIGLQSCPTIPCHSVEDGMGFILYNGGYNPQYHQNAPGFKPPHQNFTVSIPSTAQKGKAQLGVTHVSLIGAGASPFLETLNVTLNVV